MEGRQTPSQSEATGGRKNEIDACIDFMYWTAVLPTKIQIPILTHVLSSAGLCVNESRTFHN